MLFASMAAANAQLKAGRLRALGVTSLEPTPLLPGLPAIAQSGVPGYSYELWWGLFAPAGIPADRLNFINAAINKVLAGAEHEHAAASGLRANRPRPWYRPTHRHRYP